MKGLVSCYIRLSAHAIHKLAKIPFSAWAEGVLADAVNGSCPTNPLPTSFWCTVGQPMHGKTTLFFFFTSRICFTYVIVSNLKKDIFWQGANQLRLEIECLTCSPMFFFVFFLSNVFFPLGGFLILHFQQKYLTGLNQVLNSVSCPLRGL